jgi:hypothetical protein
LAKNSLTEISRWLSAIDSAVALVRVFLSFAGCGFVDFFGLFAFGMIDTLSKRVMFYLPWHYCAMTSGIHTRSG